MSEYKTPNFSIDLSGQIALVTGASSGLGYRFAKVLASCGAKVAISARRKEKLESLAEEIKANGDECMVVPIDMTDRKSIRSAVDAVSKEMGTIDTLVNNAGIPDAQWAVKQSEELIDNVMETNLTGPYILSCEVARKLIEEKKPGRMVNIASVAAVEWSKSYINVNAIAPGAFSSEMLDGMIERVGDFSQAFPRKRICTPEQMDSTLLFLVSPSSECVTGTCIKIDDGQGPR